MSNNPEFLVIDGTALLFRSYFGGVSVSAPDGTEVGAVLLTCNKIGQLVSRFRSRHVMVVFDAGQHTFRNDLDPAYKANRGAPPPDLVPQFDLVRQACEALGFLCSSIPGFEADDLMATAARLCREADMDCRLVTVDKDIAQVVFDGPPQIIQQDPYKDRCWDEAAVRDRMGVDPQSVCALMALVGDSTDNIPGVRGIGPKTAAAVIRHFGDIDSLFDRLGEVAQLSIRGAKTLGPKLERAEADARLALALVTLRSDVPMGLEARTLADASRWTGPENGAEELFDRLGFHRPLSFMRSLTRSQA